MTEDSKTTPLDEAVKKLFDAISIIAESPASETGLKAHMCRQAVLAIMEAYSWRVLAGIKGEKI